MVLVCAKALEIQQLKAYVRPAFVAILYVKLLFIFLGASVRVELVFGSNKGREVVPR